MCSNVATRLEGAAVPVRDGRQVLLRPVRANDARLVQDFVRSLSLQSRRRRFFSALSELTPYMLRRLTQPAYPQEFGLLALAGAAGSGEVVGMAQYALEAPCGAELGVVVADAWQRQGLATRFIQALGDHASLAGARTLRGLMLADNSAVLALMQRLRWTMLGTPEPGLVQFEKPLERVARSASSRESRIRASPASSAT